MDRKDAALTLNMLYRWVDSNPDTVKALADPERIRLDFLLEGKGQCDGHGCDSPNGQTFHSNTAYANTISNYRMLCSECQIIDDEYWAGMWEEYYASRL